ncbi:MAG: phage Gp37/Gp68 family protein [Mesorhizobium sp.]|nr:MAG: phage Gp37/Gp68 family protein [Mesorhizobium sp.]
MADGTSIEWTQRPGTKGASWNPVRARNRATGKVGWHCTHDSEGCRFCYAETFNRRLGTGLAYKPGHERDIDVFLDQRTLQDPLRWKTPRTIFCGSMTDLFAPFVSDDDLDDIFAIAALSPQHTFIFLTKRGARLRAYMANVEREALWMNAVARRLDATPELMKVCHPILGRCAPCLPLPNVWLGVSAEDQASADRRVPELLETPAAIRFVSAEPLLGPIDFTPKADLTYQMLSEWYGPNGFDPTGSQPRLDRMRGWFPKLDWIIVGGESGTGARPMHPTWARSIRDQCAAAGVPFFFKQWGAWRETDWQLCAHPLPAGTIAPAKPYWVGAGYGLDRPSMSLEQVGKKAAGRLLDGVEHSEFPKVTA